MAEMGQPAFDLGRDFARRFSFPAQRESGATGNAVVAAFAARADASP